MPRSQGKVVVEELSRLWKQVAEKGQVAWENSSKQGGGYAQHTQKLKDAAILHKSTLFDKFPKLSSGFSVRVGNRVSASTGQLLSTTKDKVQSGMTAYEDFIGIRQVREAHDRVLEAEVKFIDSQNSRREAQKQLTEVQNALRLLRADIDRTARGDDRYLELIKKEIDIIREERLLRAKFEDLEKVERESFAALSNAFRFSHEKERAQNEKTKYWSVIGSVTGAILGIIGTTINSRMKQQQTRAILAETSAQVNQMDKSVQELATKIDSILAAEKTVSLADSLQEHQKMVSIRTDELMKATSALESQVKYLTATMSTLANSASDNNSKPIVLVPSHSPEVSSFPQDKNILTFLAGTVAIAIFSYYRFM